MVQLESSIQVVKTALNPNKVFKLKFTIFMWPQTSKYASEIVSLMCGRIKKAVHTLRKQDPALPENHALRV